MGLCITLVIIPIYFFVCVGIVVRNTLVLYDREHKKIGFWKTNCSELWERLHVSDAPPPVPPNSEGTNLTKAFQPSVAPSASQHNIHQGNNIIFYYSIFILSINEDVMFKYASDAKLR